MTDEIQKQKDKEEAILLALQQNMALLRRGLEVYGMKKDASEILISKSENYDELWKDALIALQKDYS